MKHNNQLTDDELWGTPIPFWHVHTCMGCGEMMHCVDKECANKVLSLCGPCMELVCIKSRSGAKN